jgi:hypothetical protein
MRKRLVVPGSGSVVTELGNPDAPIGSRPWALHFILYARERAHDAHLNVSYLQKVLKKLKEGQAHKAVGFSSYGELLEREIKITEAQADAVMAAPPDVTVAMVLANHGGDRKSEEAKAKADQGDIVTLKERGNSADYLKARLVRDSHHDIVARVDAGEISARAGAIEAGIITVKTPLERIQSAIERLTDGELVNLVEWLRDRLDGAP